MHEDQRRPTVFSVRCIESLCELCVYFLCDFAVNALRRPWRLIFNSLATQISNLVLLCLGLTCGSIHPIIRFMKRRKREKNIRANLADGPLSSKTIDGDTDVMT